jgi:ketosteroid isomerase-like protein
LESGRCGSLYEGLRGLSNHHLRRPDYSQLAIKVLDADYASATGNFHLERTAAGGGNADGIFSLIFKRDSTGWKIILDHTSRIG